MELENSRKIRRIIALVFLSIVAIILILAVIFSDRNKTESEQLETPEITLLIVAKSQPVFNVACNILSRSDELFM